MSNSKPPFWDDPEGIILKWISFGCDYPEETKGYTKKDLEQKYLETVKRTKHGFNSIYSSEKGFEQAWLNIDNCDYFYPPIKGVYKIKKQLWKEYDNYLPHASVEEQALFDELFWSSDDPYLQKICRILKRPITFEGHRYISGRTLYEIISNMLTWAEKRIIVVSPYVHKTSLTEKLIRENNRIKKKWINQNPVIFFTRKPRQRDKENLEGYNFLLDEDVDVRDKNKTHAKMVIIDEDIAVISSYNWTSYPEVGDTWDSGIVTIDKDIIQEIIDSLGDMP